jgi:hypothetical protein
LGRLRAVLEQLGEVQLASDVDRLRVPVTTEKMGQLVVEIFVHGLKLWPVDRECKEEENQGGMGSAEALEKSIRESLRIDLW